MSSRPGGQRAERVLGRQPIEESAATPAPFKYTRRRARAKGEATSRVPRGWWIRLRVAMLNDAAVMMLHDTTFRRFVELQLVAAEQESRDGRLPELQALAWRLHVPESQLQGELEQLQAIGRAAHTAAGWSLPLFAGEQDAATTAERVADWRDRQAAKRGRNGDANGDANAPVTKRYADREQDREQDRDQDGEQTRVGVSSPSVQDDEQERLAYAVFMGAQNPAAYARSLPASWRESAPAGWEDPGNGRGQLVGDPCVECGAVLGHSPSCSMAEVTV